jgi:hypothetical protein
VTGKQRTPSLTLRLGDLSEAGGKPYPKSGCGYAALGLFVFIGLAVSASSGLRPLHNGNSFSGIPAPRCVVRPSWCFVVSLWQSNNAGGGAVPRL